MMKIQIIVEQHETPYTKYSQKPREMAEFCTNIASCFFRCLTIYAKNTKQGMKAGVVQRIQKYKC